MKSIRRILVGCLFAFAAARTAAAQANKTVVYVVRHAEKAAEPANDPVLSPMGEARAKDLLTVLHDAGVNAIITTQLTRTKATAAPLAQAMGVTPEVVQAGGADHARAVAEAVRKHAGQTVLVVGHSNTVTAIIAALGAKEPPVICDASYDNLYVVTVADGKANVAHARYGVRTPDDQGCPAPK